MAAQRRFWDLHFMIRFLLVSFAFSFAQGSPVTVWTAYGISSSGMAC